HDFLVLFSATDGHWIRPLVEFRPHEGNPRFHGFSVGADGSLWYIAQRKPSCAVSIVRLDPRTGQRRSIVSSGPNETYKSPAPSPDGAAVAYEVSPCHEAPPQRGGGHAATSAVAPSQVLVRDLRSGRAHRISVPGGGASAP